MSPLIPDSDLGANFSLQRHKNKIWVTLECLKEVPFFVSFVPQTRKCHW
jgi:hypothetical protein